VSGSSSAWSSWSRSPSVSPALAVEPKVLLLDEPFGALDARVRKELRRWLRQLHDQIHLTTLFVTHDQEEALEVADRVAILREGRLEQIGTPQDIYDRPASPFVYDFLGNVNLFHGRTHEGRVHIGDTAFDLPHPTPLTQDRTVAYVRPHDIRVSREPRGPATLPARVLRVQSAGPIAQLELQRLDDPTPFSVQLSQELYRQLQPRAGETVHVELHNIRVFTEDYSI
jgi:sulfate/thiosulfate transport system ATP-binding protein